MGQKVNPVSFRIGVSKTWSSRWFGGKKRYSQNVLEDYRIRQFLQQRLKLAGLVRAEIERLIHQMKITLYVTRPGVVIGRGGTGLEELKKAIIPLISLPEPGKNLQIDVAEVKEPDLSAQLVVSRIANELERRLPHRRVIKRTMERVMAAGAKGIKIVLSGRINGAEIARTEKYHQGKIPLSTLRADIDYAEAPSMTRSGYVGIKVWIYKEEKD
jgi:small subunit ribosomal protein S3